MEVNTFLVYYLNSFALGPIVKSCLPAGRGITPALQHRSTRTSSILGKKLSAGRSAAFLPR